MHFADEIFQHLAGNGKIGDDAVLHRADRLNVARSAAQHAFGLHAHSENTAVVARAELLANGDYRGFVQDDAFIAYKNEGIGSAEVDGQVVGEVSA